jgi:hypothetical protein
MADCPFAFFGGAGEFALLPPLPPQPATANAVSTSAALARKVMVLVRVMLAPFVGCVKRDTQRACGRTEALASRSHR